MKVTKKIHEMMFHKENLLSLLFLIDCQGCNKRSAAAKRENESGYKLCCFNCERKTEVVPDTYDIAIRCVSQDYPELPDFEWSAQWLEDLKVMVCDLTEPIYKTVELSNNTNVYTAHVEMGTDEKVTYYRKAFGVK